MVVGWLWKFHPGPLLADEERKDNPVKSALMSVVDIPLRSKLSVPGEPARLAVNGGTNPMKRVVLPFSKRGLSPGLVDEVNIETIDFAVSKDDEVK
jgi:hypothetical protein